MRITVRMRLVQGVASTLLCRPVSSGGHACEIGGHGWPHLVHPIDPRGRSSSAAVSCRARAASSGGTCEREGERGGERQGGGGRGGGRGHRCADRERTRNAQSLVRARERMRQGVGSDADEGACHRRHKIESATSRRKQTRVCHHHECDGRDRHRRARPSTSAPEPTRADVHQAGATGGAAAAALCQGRPPQQGRAAHSGPRRPQPEHCTAHEIRDAGSEDGEPPPRCAPRRAAPPSTLLAAEPASCTSARRTRVGRFAKHQSVRRRPEESRRGATASARLVGGHRGCSAPSESRRRRQLSRPARERHCTLMFEPR